MQTTDPEVVRKAMSPESRPGTLTRLSFVQTAKYIFKTKGVRGFYGGLGVTLLRAGPANATIFCTYELCIRMFDSLDHK